MATTDKYDRQLRLWGASGQRALGETCVVLVRATAAGTETLKNLVLPGIGAFCIVDDGVMDSSDSSKEYASNFFLTASSADTAKSTSSSSPSRAEMATTHLQELNSDVQGSFHHVPRGTSLLQYVQQSIDNNNDNNNSNGSGCLTSLVKDKILSNNKIMSSPNEITKILVVASDLEPSALLALSRVCQEQHWPLIAVHSYGLLGVVRLQVSHPLPLFNPKRSAPPDLRLTSFCSGSLAASSSSPSPLATKMQALAKSIDWEHLDSQQYGHVPYPLILMRIQSEWLQNHEQLPRSFVEKQEFQSMIQAAARDFDQQLNFQEAKRNAYLAYNTSTRAVDTHHLQQLMDTLKKEAANGSAAASSSKFLILLQALQDFLAAAHNGGQEAPLQGTIPDMTASTQLYVQLQTLYKQQAQADLDEMRKLVEKHASSSNSNDVMISDDELTTFCQNVHVLDIFQTRSLVQEYDMEKNGDDSDAAADFDELCSELSMACMEVASDDEDNERPEMLPLFWYLGFRACQLFYQRHGRYPGTIVDADDDKDDQKYLQDVPLLQTCLEKVVQSYQLQDQDIVQKVLLKDADCKVATELTRYANAEIHNIASIVGGVASQEAVKLVTGQYVPLHHTYIYNGICSAGGVYKF